MRAPRAPRLVGGSMVHDVRSRTPRSRNSPAACSPFYPSCRDRLTRVNDRLVWIDCEMTGLDLGKDALIEIAALVTDSELNVLGDGVDLVIHADETALDGMPDVVREMHAKSGLTEAVRESTISLAEAEKQ